MRKLMFVTLLIFIVGSCSGERSAELIAKQYKECYGDTTVIFTMTFFGGELSVACHETKEQRDARILTEKNKGE